MAHTDAWGESTPLGTEDASTADNYLRNHRRDLGERLEEMIYGFNASDNTGAENEVGIKNLKLYKQTSDPTAVTDYGHFYVKLVSGVPELFYQDDTNTALQLTSGGNLKTTANLVVDGTSTLTGNVTCAGTLDVTGNIDPTSYETTNGGFLDEDDMASDAADKVASQQSIKAYVDAITDPTYSGGESHTFEGGLIIKHGYKACDGTTPDSPTFGTAFPTACISVQITQKTTAVRTYSPYITAISTTGFTIAYENGLVGYYWLAIGH